MTIVQTVLVYVVIPAAVLVVFAALTMLPKAHKSAHYRCGEEWNHPPVWWAANPEGLGEPAPTHALGAHALGRQGLGADSDAGEQAQPVGAAELVGGGARGTW